MKRALGLALALAALCCGAASAAPSAALQQQALALVQAGYDRPEQALAALATLARQQPPDAERVLLQARGLVAGNAGRAAEAHAAEQALQRLDDPLGAADALLVQAALATTQNRVGEAGEAARAALKHYERLCPAQPGCNWRSSYQALLMLTRHSGSSGRVHAAREQALAAADVARQGGDLGRQVWALATAADASQRLGDSSAAQRDLGRAQRLARLEGEPLTLARVHVYETRMHQAQGDRSAARASAEAGLVQAQRAQSPRLEAVLLANLSDIHVKSGNPQAALRAVEKALPTVRRHADRRQETVLLHNAALARIALGHAEGARRTLDELLQAQATHRADGDRAVTLREFADAFAASGDHAAALALYHRERKLAADIAARNREAVLAALQGRFDREAQQRQLQQLARESALMSQQLDNRRALHDVWVSGALVLVLAAGLVALLYRRVRRLNRHLADNHAVLRAQCRRDPLTGLANRRALHETTAALDLQRRFGGALLLVDIDHFKHVNDGHGHANGDLVLQAVARRLGQCIGERDLVVRWGGEEFLIFMPGAGLAQAEGLAARLLQAVGGEPVALPGDGAKPALRVTVSIGYGSFPLPPQRLALTLERAINLADMALYTAKNQGRNRAVGVAACSARDDAELLQAEADFDRAWRDGRITLLRLAGPGGPGGPGAPAAAAAQPACAAALAA